MRISESCAKCLFDRQKDKTNNEEYLSQVKKIIDERGENDTSPYLVYLFNKTHEKIFGRSADYKDIKKKYNDLVLGMEGELRAEIEKSNDSLAKSLMVSRVGNYIDFGAMNHVDQNEFLSLFSDIEITDDDVLTYESFLHECLQAKRFLLICDNCGEIVLDKLMLEQLKKRFPHLEIKVMVRGNDVLNDATLEDAEYSGINELAEIVSNGEAIAGTVYDMLPEDAKKAFDESDVILAKGQGNYESMYGQGFHAFYEFLCKCELFTSRFNVPRLTGIFIEEYK